MERKTYKVTDNVISSNFAGRSSNRPASTQGLFVAKLVKTLIIFGKEQSVIMT